MARVFTRRAQLAGSLTYRSWEKYAEDDKVIGKVTGFFEDSFKHIGIKIEVEEADFADGSGAELPGKVLAINSCGAINEAIEILKGQFESTKEPIYIEVIYKGKVILSKGTFAGKPCHTAELNTLDASGEVQEKYSSADNDDL